MMCAAGLLAGGVLVSGQSTAIPEPRRGAGDSVTGAFEGWFDNPDGSRSLPRRLLQPQLAADARHSDRSEQPDRAGRSRHGAADALPARPPVGHVHRARCRRTSSRPTATSGRSSPTARARSIPLRLNPDYVMSPFTEIAVGNTPPVLKFEPNGKAFQGPLATLATATTMTASVVGAAAAARLGHRRHEVHERHQRAAGRSARAGVSVRWSKYRGPGAVTFDKARPRAREAGERRRAVQRQGRRDREVQRAGRLRAPRHRQRLLRRRRRRLRLLLDDVAGQGLRQTVARLGNRVIG